MKMSEKISELKAALYDERLKRLDAEVEVAILHRELFYKLGYLGFLLDEKNKETKWTYRTQPKQA